MNAPDDTKPDHEAAAKDARLILVNAFPNSTRNEPLHRLARELLASQAETRQASTGLHEAAAVIEDLRGALQRGACTCVNCGECFMSDERHDCPGRLDSIDALERRLSTLDMAPHVNRTMVFTSASGEEHRITVSVPEAVADNMTARFEPNDGS